LPSAAKSYPEIAAQAMPFQLDMQKSRLILQASQIPSRFSIALGLNASVPVAEHTAWIDVKDIDEFIGTPFHSYEIYYY